MESFYKINILKTLVLMLSLGPLTSCNLSGAEGDRAPEADPLRFKREIDWGKRLYIPITFLVCDTEKNENKK